MTDHAAPPPSPKALADYRTSRDVYWYRTDTDRIPLCLSCAYWRRRKGIVVICEAVAARGKGCVDCKATIETDQVKNSILKDRRKL